jgi:hypothetical protein
MKKLVLCLFSIGLALSMLMTGLLTTMAQASVVSTSWAILISGGWNTINNHARYWNDISEMYQILTGTYGYTADHVFVLYADGNPPTQQNCNDPLNVVIDYPTDIIDFAATLANLDTVTDTIDASIDSDDTLFVHTNDHGIEDGSLVLWGETFSPETFASFDYIGKITQYAWRAFEMKQCYSGAFVAPLSGPRTFIGTSCRDDEPSYGGVVPHEMYGEFTFYFNSALKGAESESTGGVAVNADANGDDRVSFVEAFNYAQAHDQAPEHPQCDDNGDHASHEGQMPAGGDGSRGIGFDFGLIMGRVGNADTGFPLPYSTVTIEGPVDQEVETDYDGRYAIFGLTPGAYMVTASHMGCKNGYYTFVQSDIEFRTRNFMLDPIRPGPIPYKMQRT